MTERRNMREELRWIGSVRFVAACLLFIFFDLIKVIGWMDFPLLLFSVAPLFAMFVNQPYPWLINRIKNKKNYFLISQILDIVTITWGMYFLGGMDMFVLVLAYPLVFIFTGIVLSAGRTFFMANLAFLFYAGMVYAEHQGILPSVSAVGVEMSDRARLLFTSIVWIFYNLIAFFVAYLTGRLMEREKELLRTNSLLGERSFELKNLQKSLEESANRCEIVMSKLKERERQIKLLKKEVNQLLKTANQPEAYPADEVS